jgi:hypothetical protein
VVPAALSLTLLRLGDPSEVRLDEELRLQGIDVSTVDAPPGFATWSVPAQLDVAAPGPSAWLLVDEGGTHLHLAFVEDRRAVLRIVDAAPGEEDRLALAARELLWTGVPTPPPPPPPAPPDPTGRRPTWSVAAAGVLAPWPDSGGLRGGIEGELGDRLGIAVGAQLGAEQVRGTAVAVGRWRWARAGVGLDVVSLPWVLWAQPRIELGASVDGPGASFVEPRLRLCPLRDRVEEGDAVRYDSGWVELAVVIGWRQIAAPP